MNVASPTPDVFNNTIVSPTLIISGFDANVPLMLKYTGLLGPCVGSFTSSVNWLLEIENTIP